VLTCHGRCGFRAVSTLCCYPRWPLLVFTHRSFVSFLVFVLPPFVHYLFSLNLNFLQVSLPLVIVPLFCVLFPSNQPIPVLFLQLAWLTRACGNFLISLLSILVMNPKAYLIQFQSPIFH